MATTGIRISIGKAVALSSILQSSSNSADKTRNVSAMYFLPSKLEPIHLPVVQLTPWNPREDKPDFVFLDTFSQHSEKRHEGYSKADTKQSRKLKASRLILHVSSLLAHLPSPHSSLLGPSGFFPPEHPAEHQLQDVCEE